MTSRAGEGVPRKVKDLGRSPSTRMRGRLGCGGSERSTARARSCTTSESVPTRCGCTRAHRPSHYGPGGRLAPSGASRPHEASLGFSGYWWGASGEGGPGRASSPINRSRFLCRPLERASCRLGRSRIASGGPHAASGCLSSAATLTHRAGSKCFLAAAHEADSLKRSTRPQAGVEKWRPQRHKKTDGQLVSNGPEPPGEGFRSTSEQLRQLVDPAITPFGGDVRLLAPGSARVVAIGNTGRNEKS